MWRNSHKALKMNGGREGAGGSSGIICAAGRACNGEKECKESEEFKEVEEEGCARCGARFHSSLASWIPRIPRLLLHLLRFSNIDIPVERSELQFRSTSIDQSIRRPIELHAIFSMPGAGVFDNRLAGRGVHLDVEVAVYGAVVALQFDLRLQVGRQGDIYVAVKRTEGHGLVRGDLVERHQHAVIQGMYDGRAGNMSGCGFSVGDVDL